MTLKVKQITSKFVRSEKIFEKDMYAYNCIFIANIIRMQQ